MQHQNHMDEVIGIISMNISNSLLLYLEGFTTPWAIWIKFQTLFGTINKFRALQIEAESTSLAPDSFPTIDDFLMKFKSLRSQLEGVGTTKIDTKCIYLILTKL